MTKKKKGTEKCNTVYTVKASFPEEGDGVPVTKLKLCALPISVGSLHHENGKFRSTLEYLEQHFDRLFLVIGDTLQRYTKAINYPSMSETDRYKATIAEGQDWLAKNRESLNSVFGEGRYEVIWWKDLLSTEYKKTYDSVSNLLLEENEFCKEVEQYIDDFLSRKRSRDERLFPEGSSQDSSGSDEDTLNFKANSIVGSKSSSSENLLGDQNNQRDFCKDYLKEEIAALSTFFRSTIELEKLQEPLYYAYPGPIKPLETFLEQRGEMVNPLVLKIGAKQKKVSNFEQPKSLPMASQNIVYRQERGAVNSENSSLTPEQLKLLADFQASSLQQLYQGMIEVQKASVEQYRQAVLGSPPKQAQEFQNENYKTNNFGHSCNFYADNGSPEKRVLAPEVWADNDKNNNLKVTF